MSSLSKERLILTDNFLELLNNYQSIFVYVFRFSKYNRGTDPRFLPTTFYGGTVVTMKTLQKHHFYIYIFLMLVGSLLLSSCGKTTDPTSPSTAEIAATASLSSVTLAPIAETTATSNSSLPAEAIVGQSIAYYFPDINGAPNFYAAFEINNIGQTPIYLKEATISFKYKDTSISQPFTPVQSEDDILAPEKTQAYAIWFPTDQIKSLDKTTPIDVTIEITTSVSDPARTSRVLSVDNLHLIQNYPSFPTLNGSINNSAEQRDFSLFMLYTAFYDSDDQLLGVWNSTEPLNITSDSRRNFVNYIRMLPIPELAENTIRIEGRGVGFE